MNAVSLPGKTTHVAHALERVGLRCLGVALFGIASTGLASAADAPMACADALPTTMRAVQLIGYGGPEKLQPATIALPTPQAGEVLVRVSAASVNPIDWKIRERGTMSASFRPQIPGGDIAGVVVAVGTGVQAWHCGDEVVAWLERSRQGGYAQYVPVRVDDLAHKPSNLTWREAAGYPLVALTAWQAVVEAGKVAAGERVLVHGGAGGVGSMAVQIAKARGAYVITTASGRNRDYVKSIGADEAIDYTTTAFETAVHDVDLVVDTVGGDALKRSPGVLKRGGRLISVAGRSASDQCKSAGIFCATEEVQGRGDALEQISALFAQGKLRINIDATFPLEQAAQAQELNRAGHTRGKIVLDVRDDAASGAATP